jgi:tetratricopeptide (TPR) repeat protein
MRPGRRIIALLLTASPVYASYERAIAAFQSGRFSEALALISSLPGQESQQPAAQNLRSLALMNLQRYDEALDANRRARKLDSVNANYIYNEGIILLTKGDLPEAERTFQKAIGKLPRSSRLYEGLGETLFRMSRYREAEPIFRHAIELDGANSGAQVALAKVLYAVGDKRNFEDAILRAIRMAPDNYLACYYFGKYLEQKGDLDGGRKAYEKSCALAQFFFDGLIAWGQVLFRQNQPAEAATVYERARASRPNDAGVYYLLSLAYRKLGDAGRTQRALDQFNRYANP